MGAVSYKFVQNGLKMKRRMEPVSRTRYQQRSKIMFWVSLGKKTDFFFNEFILGDEENPDSTTRLILRDSLIRMA